MNIPNLYKGELKILHVGIFLKWKSTFVVLEDGKLSLHEPEHLVMTKQYNLMGYFIFVEESDTPEMIRLKSHTEADICMKAGSLQSKNKWLENFINHIKFAIFYDKHSKLKLKEPSVDHSYESFRDFEEKNNNNKSFSLIQHASLDSLTNFFRLSGLKNNANQKRPVSVPSLRSTNTGNNNSNKK
jgi:hypothetical protein